MKSIKNDAVIHTKRDNTFRILIAPTLRRNPASPHPFKELYRQREIFSHIAAPHGMNIEFIWRFHPNDPHIHAAELPDTSHVGVHEVDMIITDYSSIFYEAAFFEKYVLFYVPDLNAFKATPGIYINLEDKAKTLMHTTPQQLVDTITQIISDS